MINIIYFVNSIKTAQFGRVSIKNNKKVLTFAKILLQVNIIKKITFYKIKNQEYICVYLNKKPIINLFIRRNKVTLNKNELRMLQRRERAYYIISNDTGLNLVSPYVVPKLGGHLIAKIQI